MLAKVYCSLPKLRGIPTTATALTAEERESITSRIQGNWFIQPIANSGTCGAVTYTDAFVDGITITISGGN